VRFFMLQAHYASTLDFTNEAISAAEKGYKRMMAAMETLEKIKPGGASSFGVAAFEQKCYDAMNDDFNCPILLAQLFEGVNLVNRTADGLDTLTAADLATFKKVFYAFTFDVLGLKSEKQSGNTELVDGLMKTILEIRQEAKTKKDFATSDAIRDKLNALNITIKDGKEGVSWDLG